MQGDIETSEQLQAKLASFEFALPVRVCPSDRKIQRMCVNHECEQSFMCNQASCQSCGKKHLDCPSVTLSGVTTRLNEKVNIYQNFVRKAYEIENYFINQIQESRKELVAKFHMGKFQKNYLELIDEIFGDKDRIGLSGKQAKEFYERIKKDSEDSEKKGALLLEDYQKKLSAIFPRVIDLQSMLYQEFVKDITIDSQIIDKKHENRIEYLKFLRQSLTFPTKVDLLFRASQHKFSSSVFHKKCDNIADTFTLVKTEFGKIIGGFTHYTWNAVKQKYVTDEDMRAFLISFDMLEKFPAVGQNDLIYCGPGQGPSFGGGHDLFLSDRCGQNNTSYACFPTCYNTQKEVKYTNNQESYEAFSGAKQNSHFRVLQYEVFKVVYQ